MATLHGHPLFKAETRDGTWLGTTGNWSDPTIWASSVVANGIDGYANFTSINITADKTVTIDTARTIGNIVFTDQTTASNNLIIDGANPLTFISSVSGGDINVTQATRTVTISAPIAGTGGIRKSGPGYLYLTGNNTFSGGINIASGYLQVSDGSNANALGSASNMITFTGNSTFYNSNNAFNFVQPITINSGVTATFAGAFGESTIASGVLEGSGTLNILSYSNGWAITFSNAANTFSGPIDFVGTAGLGTLTMSSLVDSANPITLNSTSVSGVFAYDGTTPLTLNNRQFVMSGTTGGWSIVNSAASASNIMTLTRDLSVSGTGAKILSFAGTNTGANIFSGLIPDGASSVVSISKSGNGNWTLSGNNTFTGSLSAASGTGTFFLTGSNSYTGQTVCNAPLSITTIANYGTNCSVGKGTAGVAIQVGGNGSAPSLYYTGGTASTNRQIMIGYSGNATGGTIYSNGTGALTFTATTFNLAPGGTQNRTMTLRGTYTGANNVITGDITDVSGTLGVTILDSSRWEFSGACTYTGTTTVSGGTLTLSGARVAATCGSIVVNTVGTLTITNGTYTLGTNTIAVGISTNGTFNQSGGSVTLTAGGTQFTLGSASGLGVFNLSGGTFTTGAATSRGIIMGVNTGVGGGTINLSGTGTLQMASGGNSLLQIGRSDAAANNTTNLFNQTGGTATIGILAMGGAAAAGSTGVTATLTVSGGTFVANTFTLLSAGNTNASEINISGTADVTLPAFPTTRGTSSTALVRFDGGTLKPTASSTTYMQSLTNVFIKTGGFTFDTSGYDITINQILRTHATSLNGGLTKLGTGTLTLTATATYTGTTTVSAGSLKITGSIASSTAVSVSGGTLEGPSTTGASATAGGTVTVSDSTTSKIRPGSFGNNTLNTGALTFSGTSSRMTVDLTTTTMSKIAVTGNVALGGMGIVFTAGTTPASGTYSIITSTGTISGTLPTIITQPTGVTVTLNNTGTVLQVIVP
jgi:fibronectin-binding autotransporter adhesin